MSIHDGHRSRMKNRFINYGLLKFDDHNVLELFLFYALQRRDINPIAHELLTRFGSLDAVFEAPIEDIMEVPYMGENAAVLLKLIPQVCRRYMTTRCIGEGILDSSAKVGEYITPSFMYEKDEVVFMLCLDAKRKLLCCCELSRGVVNTVEVSVRKIVRSLSKECRSRDTRS
jgi:DNA repair protein RadC